MTVIQFHLRPNSQQWIRGGRGGRFIPWLHHKTTREVFCTDCLNACYRFHTLLKNPLQSKYLLVFVCLGACKRHCPYAKLCASAFMHLCFYACIWGLACTVNPFSEPSEMWWDHYCQERELSSPSYYSPLMGCALIIIALKGKKLTLVCLL